MPDSLLNELYQEAAVTRQVLERVPGDKLERRLSGLRRLLPMPKKRLRRFKKRTGEKKRYFFSGRSLSEPGASKR
jgi:hypothetical protein